MAATPARRSCGPNTRTMAPPGARTRPRGRMPPGAAASPGAALPERAAQRRHPLRYVPEGRRVEVEIREHVEGARLFTGALERIGEFVHHAQTLLAHARRSLRGALQPLDAFAHTPQPQQKASELRRSLELDRGIPRRCR